MTSQTINNGQRREDDVFARRVIKTLIGVIIGLGTGFVLGVGSYIYLIGTIANQQDIHSQLIESNTRAIQNLNQMHSSLSSLTTQTGIMANSMQAMSKNLAELNAKLNQFTPVVDRADRYIDEHIKQHNQKNR